MRYYRKPRSEFERSLSVIGRSMELDISYKHCPSSVELLYCVQLRGGGFIYSYHRNASLNELKQI